MLKEEMNVSTNETLPLVCSMGMDMVGGENVSEIGTIGTRLKQASHQEYRKTVSMCG